MTNQQMRDALRRANNLRQQIAGDWEAAVRYKELARRATSARMQNYWIKCEVETVQAGRTKEAELAGGGAR